MNIDYTEFTFISYLKAILFIGSCVAMTVYHFWGVNIILQIYQKNESSLRKLIFSFLSAISLSVLVKNGAWIIFGYIVLYVMGIKILRLSRLKSSKIMLLCYIYYGCCTAVRKIPGATIFPPAHELYGLDDLRELLAVTSGTLLCYAIYKLISKMVDKYGLYINLIENNTIVSIRYELLKNFVLCSTLYFFYILIYSYFSTNILEIVIMVLICSVYLLAIIGREQMKISARQIRNKDEHIAILNQMIDEFNGVRHDFNNILQTYTGYLTIEDIENLRVYHQKVTRLTTFTGNNLDMSRRLNENPPFFSLIMNKIERAAEYEVVMQIMLQCSMQYVYMDILDFNRIMSILLDNAIEAAAQTAVKQVSINGQMRPDGSKLFIIANETDQEVKIEDILKPGYTTKEGHMGQGLPQVRNILNKYGNSTIDFSCYKGIFTVYFEVKV